MLEVGDIVRIADEETIRKYPECRDGVYNVDGLGWLPGMMKYCGKEFKVVEVYTKYNGAYRPEVRDDNYYEVRLDIEGRGWHFNEAMLNLDSVAPPPEINFNLLFSY